MTRNHFRIRNSFPRFLFATIVCIACRDHATPPLAPIPPVGGRPAPAGRVVLSPDDTTWNSFTTEVGVLVTGDYPHWGIVDPQVSRSFGFTLTRSALPAGNWANVLAFDPATPSNLAPDPGDYETNLGRVEHDDFRTYSRIYNRLGQLIPMAIPDTTVPPTGPTVLPPARDTGSYPSHPTGPGIPMPLPRLGTPRASGSAARVTMHSSAARAREWIDFFIVGPEARQRLRQQIIAAGGVSVTTAQGLEELTLSIGPERNIVTLDRVSGAPAVLSRSVMGQLVMRETREYAPYGPGAWRLEKSLVESFDPGEVRPVRTFQLAYANTRLARIEP